MMPMEKFSFHCGTAADSIRLFSRPVRDLQFVLRAALLSVVRLSMYP